MMMHASAEGAPDVPGNSRVRQTRKDKDVEDDMAVLRHRLTQVEQQNARIEGKLDDLIADKERRDGALAAGNWISRAAWAALGVVGAMFFERNTP